MGNSDTTGGCFAIVIIIGTTVSWIGSGALAWNWLEPDSFGQVVVFLIVWGILGKVFDFVLSFILVGLANMMD